MNDQPAITASFISTQWKSHVELTFTPQAEVLPSNGVKTFKPLSSSKPENVKPDIQIQHLSDQMTEMDNAFQLMMEIREKLEDAFQKIENQLN